MFLKTADELDSSYARHDPGLSARPYAEGDAFEARAGEPLPAGVAPATAAAVVEALKAIYDPEIPVNIYDLGLVYDIHVAPTGDARVLMTLTAPNCPAAEILPGEVAGVAARVPGVGRVGVELTFEVPWNPDFLSEAARLELNLF